jgi:hypothetical protein
VVVVDDDEVDEVGGVLRQYSGSGSGRERRNSKRCFVNVGVDDEKVRKMSL